VLEVIIHSCSIFICCHIYWFGRMFQTKPSECGAHRKMLCLKYHNSESLMNTVCLCLSHLSEVKCKYCLKKWKGQRHKTTHESELQRRNFITNWKLFCRKITWQFMKLLHCVPFSTLKRLRYVISKLLSYYKFTKL